MKKTEAIKSFLDQSGNNHRYDQEMEVQVQVAQDGGKRIFYEYLGKKRSAWTDGIETWKSFRIPFGSNSKPFFNDTEISFDLTKHVEAIGMTGWNWVKKQSMWVGFDIDSIINHKSGLTEFELERVKEAVLELPYVTLIKSTSGKGLHAYVYLEDHNIFKTETHTEHSLLAKAILNTISKDIGFSLKEKIDVFGSILWCYHRKQIGTDGFSLIKKGELFSAKNISPEWKINTDPTKSFTTKKDFRRLYDSIKSEALDEDHRKLLKWFNQKADRDFWWDAELNMFVCHTLDLKKVHTDLKLKGLFTTNSSGTSSQNCFMFPELNGGWVVRRHGKGVTEDKTWVKDNSGWTKTFFNEEPEIDIAARSCDCVIDQKRNYVFKDHKKALETLKYLGIILEMPDYYKYDPNPRQAIIIEKKNLITFMLEARSGENCPDNFIQSKKGYIETSVPYYKERKDFVAPDNLIRYGISNESEVGWFVNIKNSWVKQNKNNVSSVLMSEFDFSRQEVDSCIGKILLEPWLMVNEPFKEEYLGKRRWNKSAASFKITPKEGVFPFWNSVLDHCGKGLNQAVKENAWCIQNSILSGSDYLTCWFANLLQRPEQPLPYLFFIGEQNTGKSTLHEGFDQFIIKNGYKRADKALTSQQGYNYELSNAVLCVVEETDLRKNKEAGDRIKDWVTGKTISIRDLYKGAYDIENKTHWIQCANDINYCVIGDKDVRIVIIRVPVLEKEIPKYLLFENLQKEAPYFLYHLLSVDLPDPIGRLAMDIVVTSEKKELLDEMKSELELFVEEKGKCCDGHITLFNSIYNQFIEWLAPDKKPLWGKLKFAKEFPKIKNICKGKLGSNNETVIANYTMDLEAMPENFKYILNIKTGRVVKDANSN